MCPGPSCQWRQPHRRSHPLTTRRLADEAEAVDPNDVAALEAFLSKHASQLHPNHYNLLGVKHSLSQVYGKVHGYLIHELPDALLERKLTICRDIMRIFDVLEPGISRLRGEPFTEPHVAGILELVPFTINTLPSQVSPCTRCTPRS